MINPNEPFVSAADCFAMQIRAEAAEAENARLREMFTQLRDCNWVITQPDLMDAVRDFACAALATNPVRDTKADSDGDDGA